MAGSANSIQTHNVLRGRLSEDNVIAGTVGTGYNPTYALVGEAAAQIVLYINSSDYKMYAELKDKNGNHIMNSNIIDLPLETMVVNGSYDSETREVVLILDNGNELRFSVADLVRGLVSEEDLVTTLGDYVKFTDYATGNNSGIIKVDANNYGINTNAQGKLYVGEANYQQYETKGVNYFIGKGTLENVITGKQLVNKTYVDEADEVFEEDLFGDALINDSGESIILNNTIEQAPLSITLKGNSYQDSTSGKNLFDTTLYGTKTSNGITLTTNEDGTYTLNGTSTVGGYTDFNLRDAFSIVGTGEEIVSANVISGTADKLVEFQLCQTSFFNPLYINVKNSTGNPTYRELVNGNTYTTTTLRIGGNCVCNNLRFSIQVEKGTTPTSFEKYTGGQASPNPDYPQDVEVVTGLNEVKVEGKNLFDKDNANVLNAYISLGNSKIIYSNGDNCVYIPIKNNTTYTITKTLSNRFVVGCTDVLPATAIVCNPISTSQSSNTTYTITSGNDSKYLVIYCYTISDTLTLQEILNSIQIEEGSQATTYEAYKGQTYEVNLGKNLFDVSKVINGTWNNPESTTRIILYLDKVKKGTTISVTNNDTSGYRFATGFTRLGYPDTSNVMVNESSYITSSTYTITADNDGYPFLQITKLNNTNISPSEVTGLFQIEKSDTPTTYAPYFTPIELCKIGTYQDRIYKSNGNWYLHKEVGKVVLDGTNNAFDLKSGQQGNSYTFDTLNFIAGPALTDVPLFLSDKFIPKSWNDRINYLDSTIMFIYSSATNLVFRFGTSSNITTLELANAWLTNNNVTLYGILATPTETQITDTTLVNQLNALEKATSYDTRTNISQVNTNLSFILDISTFKNTTKGKIEALEQEDENYEKLSNKVIELSSSSTDTEYPSAKCVYNLIGNIESILETLDIGNGV